MDPQSDKKSEEQQPAPQEQPTFTQEMPDTTSSVPATIEGETVRTNPTPEPSPAPVDQQPMFRRDDNGRAVVDFSNRSRKTLAICAFILSICSLLLGIVWPIAALAALAAIILGILGIAKKHGGKGLSIASIAIGAFSLLIAVPFWIFFTIGFYDAFQTEYTNQMQSEVQRDFESFDSEMNESDVQSL